MKEAEQNMSSGGSYYEACGEDENVIIVPLKTRVNGVLETIQQKVISHDCYLVLKEELKDAKESAEMLKQKVEHLDSLIKLKEERIEELCKQLERKQSRRKEVEALQNSLSVPFEPEPPSPNVNDLISEPSKTSSLKSVESVMRLCKEESKIPKPIVDVAKSLSKPSITEVSSKNSVDDKLTDVDTIKSNVFKEVEIIDQRVLEGFQDSLEYINDPGTITAMDDNVQKEKNDIPQIEYHYETSYLN